MSLGDTQESTLLSLAGHGQRKALWRRQVQTPHVACLLAKEGVRAALALALALAAAPAPWEPAAKLLPLQPPPLLPLPLPLLPLPLLPLPLLLLPLLLLPLPLLLPLMPPPPFPPPAPHLLHASAHV
jgi:hypothetical protein